MGDSGETSEQDDVSFLRTDDLVCLTCAAHLSGDKNAEPERVILSAEGFGNRMCNIENISSKTMDLDLSMSVFILDQALSVRALQEMVSAGPATKSGHRTLLYGHAVLMRHLDSGMFLSCLSTSSSSDKLAFDVGLQETAVGESCWWTIHPASKQRSDGEKVRVGDDLILVSVASERYLHIHSSESKVIASFQQTLWTVAPIASGAVKMKSLAFVFGGDIVRLFHGHMDECMTIPSAGSENEHSAVMFETGAICQHARSLWRIEHLKIKWGGGFLTWGSRVKLRHVTSGRYLAVTAENQVVTVHRRDATEEMTSFLLRQSKDDRKHADPREDDDNMGVADVKNSDSISFIQHCDTNLWLSYQTFETRKRGVGKVEEKKAVMLVEGHMDDGLSFTRAQEEESRSARVIRKCMSIFTRFNAALNALRVQGPKSPIWSKINMADVILCLEDLIYYFAQPEDNVCLTYEAHEEKQSKLKALRNRQDLFQEEGMVALVLQTIDEIGKFNGKRAFAHLAGDDSAEKYDDICSYLYLLLAAMIRGNRANCSQFAQGQRLDWLVQRLAESQQSSTDVLDVFHCILIDSPEALNMIQEKHICTIISLIDKHGRSPKVLEVLCSLCVGSGVAVRANQNLICENLLPGKDLLLQTRLVDHVTSMRPNLFVGYRKGAPTFTKWYFEVIVDLVETITHLRPHLRIGWADTEGYRPFPAGGELCEGNGVGSDFYSYGFDGQYLWTGGSKRKVRGVNIGFEKGDIIGCTLDLTVPEITFTVNGLPVKGIFREFSIGGKMFPCISMSAKVSCRFILGGDHGKFRYGPPRDFSGVSESLSPKQKLVLEPCFESGEIERCSVCGPGEDYDMGFYIPNPVSTNQVQLPQHLEQLCSKLAENNHEIWAMSKIEQGWSYGEIRDDHSRMNPCITSFDRLPRTDRQYKITLAFETLKTIVAMGYHIVPDPAKRDQRHKTLKLPNNYLQQNGYKPQPLDLGQSSLPMEMEELVEQLARNTHNVWAGDRIAAGWTYGFSENPITLRTPHLVGYSGVDDAIKKANRDTSVLLVRSLIEYGYKLEPPSSDAGFADLGAEQKPTEFRQLARMYRGESTYAVTSGKWYYEFEVQTAGLMRVGWSKISQLPERTMGLDDQVYAFDGFKARKWHQGAEPFGKVWKRGDIVGCMIDLSDRTISFSLNGELMMDSLGQEIAFKSIDGEASYVPSFYLGCCQMAKLNFGQDVNSLQYFTQCGLQEGYEPFCVNMTRNMTLWYAKELPIFAPVDESSKISISRVAVGSTVSPVLRVTSKTFGTLEKSKLEFMRLSLPVRIQDDSKQDPSHAGDQGALRRRQPTGTSGNYDRQTSDGTMGEDGGYSPRSDQHPGPGRPGLSTQLEVPEEGEGMSDESDNELTDAEALQTYDPKITQDINKKTKKSAFSNLFKHKKGEQTPATEQAPAKPSREKVKKLKKNGPKRTREHDFAGTLEEKQFEQEIRVLEANASRIDTYYYGVRIFPGQDPKLIHVGWVTSGYHIHCEQFEVGRTRNVVLCQLDANLGVRASMSIKSSYMVSAGELQQRYGQYDEGGQSGLLIGCLIDNTNGKLSFTFNGREVANKFQAPPGCMLFPAVFCEATSKEMFQFELGHLTNALPLSACMFRTKKQAYPQCPPRLDVQVLKPASWGRLPNDALRVHVLKMSEIRGWSMLCETPVPMLALHVPEENRFMDILELNEFKELLEFHSKTLELYRLVCSHGNHRVVQKLVDHLDTLQLMYCIQAEYLPGPLRMLFFDLLICMHIEMRSSFRASNEDEYIIPLSREKPSGHPMIDKAFEDKALNVTFDAVCMKSPSIRPGLPALVNADGTVESEPSFPIEWLKESVLQKLMEAARMGQGCLRDPIGGTNETLFVPLLKVFSHLLRLDILNEQDYKHLMHLIHPESIEEMIETDKKGLLHMDMSEPVKLQICYILQILCNSQLRCRVEELISFSDEFVIECQSDQRRRYNEVKQADLPMAIAAKKTREFRCAPGEQMRSLINFHEEEALAVEEEEKCPCREGFKAILKTFHESIVKNCSHDKEADELELVEELRNPSLSEKLAAMVSGEAVQETELVAKLPPDHSRAVPMSKMIIETMIKWSKAQSINSHELIRQMFSLLHRQYNGLGEVMSSLDKTYVISQSSENDVHRLLEALGTIRSMLSVQVDSDEELLLKNKLWEMMDNKAFFQHPDLIRSLAIHETVMQQMMNTLANATRDESAENETGGKSRSADMVVMCCRFLCYFCRTGRANQRAMFEHLSYMLENSSMLLSFPSLRGSCPLDVAYSSLMDNNELALALREFHLEKIAVFLSRCGVQSNVELVNRGYPDIGWDPVEGERFLDFYRFCVWVNGETVEENANLVVRLLIRRPECLGPALRGEGGGLLAAIMDGIRMSEQIAAHKGLMSAEFIAAVNTSDDSHGEYLYQRKYDYSTLPSEDDEDYIDLGAAILTFYSVLVDLLGRCAPDHEAIKSGRRDSIRARSILRSLVSMSDLEGCLNLTFILPTVFNEGEGEGDEGSEERLPPGLLPEHKGSIVVFFERVYGIEDHEVFFRLLQAFLPDLRAANTLDATGCESDFALALNRYLCGNVLPLLTKHAEFFAEADHESSLPDLTLDIVYRMSKNKSLTKIQREVVSDFLVALCSHLRPPTMGKLLPRLTIDVPMLNENTVVPLRVLTDFYERCGPYYGSSGWSDQGTATEEEKRLTTTLFNGIFESLGNTTYDPELFSKALPCLSAIGCALSPEFSLTGKGRSDIWLDSEHFDPQPTDTSRVSLNDQLIRMVDAFTEHLHDRWALTKIGGGWKSGQNYDFDKLEHPDLLPFSNLRENIQDELRKPVNECLKTMIAWGWKIEIDEARAAATKAAVSLPKPRAPSSSKSYSPQPVELRTVTLQREQLQMADDLAEHCHLHWAWEKKGQTSMLRVHASLVPFKMLTENETKKYSEKCQELMKFLQVQGYRIQRAAAPRESVPEATRTTNDSEMVTSATERRFAYNLLNRLIQYLDKASTSLDQSTHSKKFSRRNSYVQATEDVKFFVKVLLPLVEKYFRAHKPYFIPDPLGGASSSFTASPKEKEMTAILFCKLASLLRQKLNAFGHDVDIAVRCLRVLVQAIDARSIVKNTPEIVRSSLLPFFNNAADDLTLITNNLKLSRFSHVKGTIDRGAVSLNYVHMVLLPVLTSMFEHLGRNGYGTDVMVNDVQLACYRILNALYVIGTTGSQHVERESIYSELSRHRPLLGECVASFASTFPVAFLEPDLNKYNKYSIIYGVEGAIEEHSLEAREVMEMMIENVPVLDKIVAEIGELAESGGKYKESPHVIEVTLPMLCSYLPLWWAQGPDNQEHQEQDTESNVTRVTADLMNKVLGDVLELIRSNIGSENAPWMTNIATRTKPIISRATEEILGTHILPVAQVLRDNALVIEADEEDYLYQKRSGHDVSKLEEGIQMKFHILVRDIYAFHPLLIKYVDLHRSHWLKNPNKDTELLYACVADVFLLWTKSQLFKREEQNFMIQNEIDNMTFIMPSSCPSGDTAAPGADKKRRGRREKRKVEAYTSLNTAALKRLLPIGLSLFGGNEQELVQHAKARLIEATGLYHTSNPDGAYSKEPELEIQEFVQESLESEEKVDADDSLKWQKQLYSKIGTAKLDDKERQTTASVVKRIISMAKVLQGLYLVDHPLPSLKNAWKKVISSQRKRAVMACFRMVPLHNLPRHRVINLFVNQYRRMWLEPEELGVSRLIGDLTVSEDNDQSSHNAEEGEDAKPDPMKQLIAAFSRGAMMETSELQEDKLYISYAEIMAQSIHAEDEEEEGEGGGGEEAPATFEEQEMEKLKLLLEQSRLSERGAAEMVLMYMSASKGVYSDMVGQSFDLGISLLLGGNVGVQKRMLEHLKEKRDVGFFMSVSGLMQRCSVLDLDAFERCNKAEGLGTEGDAGVKNLHDADFTCKLFRFLQLLCEGHNLDFQNFLRSQACNNTSVNLIIATVDYLLRLQESMMDFYWHYSSKETVDPAGADNFIRAIQVAQQVFSTLTEDIQGPCLGNQQTLAHSRLWDAVGGFLFIVAHMQDKLSKDPEQLDLMRAFMNLQKEMMIMLLSMLEGNVMNGPIGKQMVDTLVESQQNFDMILKFFDIFLKMKDISNSESFMEFDKNGDGIISCKELRQALESMKVYDEDEIAYIMRCVDADNDGKVDFAEFTDRFHEPAKDIGYNVAVLLTNLSEHMPNEPKLERFLEKASSVLSYFEPFLGRIEIYGSAQRIERVYFEIKQSNIDQWEKPQIKDSKRTFLHNCVNEDGDKEKLESFVNFCEDTIFEMQHAVSISSDDQTFTFSQLLGGGKSRTVDTALSALSSVKDFIFTLITFLSWTNIKDCYASFRAMTIGQMVLAFFVLQINIVKLVISTIWAIFRTSFNLVITMMSGESEQAAQPRRAAPARALGNRPPLFLMRSESHTTENGSLANGAAMGEEGASREFGDHSGQAANAFQSLVDDVISSSVPEVTETPALTGGEDATIRRTSLVEQIGVKTEGGLPSGPEAAIQEEAEAPKEQTFDLGKYLLGMFARNFYTFKSVSLVLAFCMNFLLLFFKVTILTGDEGADAEAAADMVNATEAMADAMANAAAAEEASDPEEFIEMPESYHYFDTALRYMAMTHSFFALGMVVAYYCLKVPLVIFKREKEISRLLEFEGMWISEQPSEDNIKGHWDKLVLSTASFPDSYWDKFVKKKVRNKYSEQFDYDEISNLLGMEKKDSIFAEESEKKEGFLPKFLSGMDWQYQIWKWGVIFTDNSFLYCLFYFIFSFLGNFNPFFFALHLLDVAVNIKTLSTILQSVTHNGKQLVLTVMLTSVVVYLYTVIAFNFFRRFYVKEEDGDVQMKCHDMMTCFTFHLYAGVRAGGGIGDEIESPDGDEYQNWRILFDITFFFSVIVILLAIIQGLIIDAFGELRDQLEQVKEDMESSCFICGIGKEYFDKVPHGFEKHVQYEHNFANYMFFLMHLINKPDTEYTGQETYVWELYQQRCWNFFPVGDCFRKQYDDEPATG